jgi:small subunit ribosomal protein S20
MPNTESAKKRLRQSEERRTRNRAIKSQLKKRVRSVRTAVAGGDIAKAESEYRTTAKHLDRAAARGTLHKNAAARLKSRLQALIKRAKGKTVANT